MVKIPDDLRIITLLIAAYKNKIEGKIRLHKIIFLLSRKYPKIASISDFEAYNYGPYGEGVESALTDLVSYGLLEKIGNDHKQEYTLTPKGRETVDKVKQDFSDFYDDIKKLMKTMDKLTDEELVALVYFTYPEYAKESKIYKYIMNKRVNIAVSLYNKDVISIGKAAEIAGMSKEKFREYLRRKGIAIKVDTL